MTHHWSALWVATISMIAGVLVAFLTGFLFEPIVAGGEVVGHKPTWGEAFGFAGVIVTILAFVGAFFILFTALDAFAVSKETVKNRALVEENRHLVNTQAETSKRLRTQLDEFKQTTIDIHRQLLIFQSFVREFGAFNVDFTTNLNSQIDFLADRLEASAEIAAVRGSRQNQLRGMARLDALSFLASDEPESTENDRGGAAFVELLESARSGDRIDRSILLLMDHAAVSKLTTEDRSMFLETASEQTLVAIGKM